MSTVLKAAQEIERRGRPVIASSVATAGSEEAVGASRSWIFVMAGLTVTAGVALLVLQTSDGEVAQPAPRVASAPVAVPVAKTAPAAVVAPVAAAAASAPVAAVAVRQAAPVQVATAEPMDAPWGRVDDDSTAPDDVPAPPARAAVASVPPPMPMPRTMARARVVAPPAPAMRRAPEPVDAEDAREESEPVGRGVVTSGVQVRQIFYANDISERAVSLRVNGGPAVILHQGESAQGVVVQLITRTGAYIRRGGSIYMVSAKR